jgi:glutathione S-transferase
MLTFYYHPLSPVARRVWLFLLEKDITFQPIVVDLKEGEQNQPAFLQLNPFHHVPVITDGEFRLIESLAILDYLESQYPVPQMLPQSSRELATMRMIQMVTANELMPKIPALTNTANVPLSKKDTKQLDIALSFLNAQLDQRCYFGGDDLNLADLVVGATVPPICRLGINLDSYSALSRWHQQIQSREAWKATEPSDMDFNQWKHRIQRQYFSFGN